MSPAREEGGSETTAAGGMCSSRGPSSPIRSLSERCWERASLLRESFLPPNGERKRKRMRCRLERDSSVRFSKMRRSRACRHRRCSSCAAKTCATLSRAGARRLTPRARRALSMLPLRAVVKIDLGSSAPCALRASASSASCMCTRPLCSGRASASRKRSTSTRRMCCRAPRPRGASRFHSSSARCTAGMVYVPFRSKSDQTCWKCSSSCVVSVFSLLMAAFFSRITAITKLRHTSVRTTKE
mmetsp:Transcript_30962/g.77431  ORF Transcript_30962/g.77431 Transcript_30962/m.77431 type:complete len:242 (+) Transcript_30962:926-1651(+)